MRTEDLLILLNEWWKNGKVGSRLKEYKRELFYEAIKLLEYRQILIITGLRRVGKSTLMFQIINEILKEVEPFKILYYTYDENKTGIIDLLNIYKKITKIDWEKEKVYVFLDEIQKLKNWSSQVKVIYDNFPNVKFILSGSASLLLEKEAKENLAGRYFLIEIPTLSLKEYFELKNKKTLDNYELYRKEILISLEDYFRKPFPEIVDWNDEIRIYEYVKESIISKLVRIDLMDIYENINPKLLESLLELFFTNPGMILNLDSLSRDLRIHKKTLLNHVFFLEYAKLIRIIKNFRPSILSETRKYKKIYPYDVSLIFPYNPNIEQGKVLECYIASLLDAKYYWREKGKEIDFIIKLDSLIPIEVKSSEKLSNEDLKNIKYFINKFGVKEGWIIYMGETEYIEKNIKAINLLDLIFVELKM